MYQYFDRQTLRGLGLGAVERRNPLPAGQYTIDVYGDDRAKMAGWVLTNQAHVVILATATEEAETDEESNVTYTFITAIPIPWDGSFGYPDIMSEVPVAASAPVVTASPVKATSAPASASTPLKMTTSYALPVTKASLVTAAPAGAAVISSASWKLGAAALVVMGGAFYYAKKKGML